MATRLENLSAYIICKNEEDWIEPCIRSLAACGEIVIVDSGSTDKTLEIVKSLSAEGYTIRLFQREWPGYSAQKQFALEQCTRDWCLCIDADERLSDDLIATMPAHLERQDIDAWRIKLCSFIHGFGYTPPSVRETELLRLSRNGKAQYDQKRLVHEGLVTVGRIETIPKGRILHRRAPALGEQMVKAINYSSLKAEQLYRAGKKPRYARLIFNPAVYFLRLFFFNRLFLTGWAGFVHCRTIAVYSFMTEAMLFQKHREAKMAEKSDPDQKFSNRRPWPAA